MRDPAPFTQGVDCMKENLPEKNKPRREKGFSILEVMIAISILSIGLLSIGVLQSAAMKGNVTSRSISEASVMASDQIETLLALPSGHGDLTDRTNDGTAGLASADGFSDWNRIDGRYTVFWNIADDVVCAGTKTVAVIVQWMDRGTNRRVVMQGVIPRVI